MRRIGIFFVVVFVLLLIISFVKRGIYSSKLGVNLVVVSDERISLALIRPNEKILTWVNLPGNLKIKIRGSEAKYPVSSLWKFGLSERHPLEIVSDSIEDTLGVLIMGTIKLKGENTPENLLGEIYRLGLYTDLSFRDRIAFRKDLVESVSSKKYFELDTPRSAMDLVVEADGKEFFELNSAVALWTKNKFVFDVLLGEDSNVKITNSSSQNGAGLLLSRKLESSGLRVVEVLSGEQGGSTERGCQYKIFGAHPQTKYLLDNFIRCKNVTQKNEQSQNFSGVEIVLR